MLCLALFCLFDPRAVDGDTIASRLANGESISFRMEGIVTPERGHPAFNETKAGMAELVDDEMLACDMTDMDRYGRPVVVCTLSDGSDLGALMVLQGMARDCPALSGGRYANEEATARSLGHDLSMVYPVLPSYCLETIR